MFCRVKTNTIKIDNDDLIEYSFYLCERYREDGRIKSKDTLIYKELDEVLKGFSIFALSKGIFKLGEAKGFNEEESNLVILKVNEIKKELEERDKRKKEECKKQYNQGFEHGYNYGYQNSYSMFNDGSSFTEEDKVLLKKFYKILAINFHPDKIGGDGEEMKLINKLKKEWNI